MRNFLEITSLQKTYLLILFVFVVFLFVPFSKSSESYEIRGENNYNFIANNISDDHKSINLLSNVKSYTNENEEVGTDGIYVRGKFGKTCYNKGEEHKNIKYLLEFDSIQDCKDSLK